MNLYGNIDYKIDNNNNIKNYNTQTTLVVYNNTETYKNEMKSIDGNSEKYIDLIKNTSVVGEDNHNYKNNMIINNK